jgi:hypothetical protein
MSPRFVPSILVILTLTMTGCEEHKVASFQRLNTFVLSAETTDALRFVAEHDKVQVVTPESGLQKSFEAAINFCGTIRCEIVVSNITARTGDSLPSGDISLRVAPEEFKKLLDYVQTLGKITEHSTERIDKTAAVVDTDAKIKNLTAFRDNLRAMLAKPSATVKDLVDIHSQLTETQSELDSETAQRKILANETEKIAADLAFRVEGFTGNAGGFARIRSALSETGYILGDSTASLITTIVALIPWLIVIAPGVWLLTKWWRKLRLRRNRAVAPTKTS